MRKDHSITNNSGEIMKDNIMKIKIRMKKYGFSMLIKTQIPRAKKI